jgi:hypothetical protein
MKLTSVSEGNPYIVLVPQAGVERRSVTALQLLSSYSFPANVNMVPGPNFGTDGFAGGKPCLHVQSDRVLYQLAGFRLRLPFGVAPLQRRADGHKATILIPLDHDG